MPNHIICLFKHKQILHCHVTQIVSSVTVPPTMIIMPPTQTALENSIQTLTCITDGANYPLYLHWDIPGSNQTMYQIKHQSQQISELSINVTKELHGQRTKCSVDNISAEHIWDIECKQNLHFTYCSFLEHISDHLIICLWCV